ncbi:hypothetical protein [Kitasatospora sp. SUK 42]|uniref:hypothetical protein n=1 Tax=Kitasatospora sp. SUK 42 TaxID=1588882 RepID=UPI0018CB2EF0|nr:hypothetical protein [Kitasatospora sp. SUK 42]MBV2154177.1 hypothetical protein [Kitasatospora sp. SUK 42]
MRNGLVQLGAWAAATGAAVALSWLGVHAVLTGAAFEQPTALPLPSPKADGTSVTTTTATPDQSRTTGHSESPAQSTSQAAPATHAPAAATTAPPPTRRPTPTPTAATTTTTTTTTTTATTSTVRSYPIPGGRVALDLRDDHASLVSATPDPGWQMKVWDGGQWLRVDFTKDDQANSVIVSWNGHPPIVDTVVR